MSPPPLPAVRPLGMKVGEEVYYLYLNPEFPASQLPQRLPESYIWASSSEDTVAYSLSRSPWSLSSYFFVPFFPVFAELARFQREWHNFSEWVVTFVVVPKEVVTACHKYLERAVNHFFGAYSQIFYKGYIFVPTFDNL